MMQLNLKRAMKTAAVLDVDLTIEDFEETERLVETLKNAIGNQCMIDLKTNKKKTFQNWEALEEAPFE